MAEGNMGYPMAGHPTAPPASWSSGLCDCSDDCSSCCLTCWCPCVTAGRIAEIVDRGATSCACGGAIYYLLCNFVGCPCLYTCGFRAKMRSQYALPEQPCGDCLVHCCCESCALCQEYRELQHRGFDMAIGWQLNVEKMNAAAGVVVPPVIQPTMMK